MPCCTSLQKGKKEKIWEARDPVDFRHLSALFCLACLASIHLFLILLLVFFLLHNNNTNNCETQHRHSLPNTRIRKVLSPDRQTSYTNLVSPSLEVPSIGPTNAMISTASIACSNILIAAFIPLC